MLEMIGIHKFRFLLYLLLLPIIAASFSGCRSRIKNVMFDVQDLHKKIDVPVYYVSDSTERKPRNLDHQIKYDDRITLRFHNNIELEEGMTVTGTETGGLSFIVDGDGMCAFPLIGRIKVLGYTKKQLTQKLEIAYGEYLINPILEVLLLDLKVSVLGAINSPGLYVLQRDRTTLTEVISDAGGILPGGRIRHVKVIRTRNDGGREVIVFDMRREEVLDSEAIILQDKDIIYVEPRGITRFTDAIAPYTSIMTIVLSISTVILLVKSFIPQ